MSELIPVNIVIGDRNYRLRIEPADEEMVRKTAALINDKIGEFKLKFAGKDMQDYISMVLIWLATEQHSNGMEAVKWSEASAQLSNLEKIIDRALTEG